MKIKYILEAINSDRDSSGNCYWAMRFTDCETGQTVAGSTAGGESNIYSIIYAWHGESFEPRDFYYYTKSLPKREFKRLTKNWTYAGCGSKELVNFIKSCLEANKAA